MLHGCQRELTNGGTVAPGMGKLMAAPAPIDWGNPGTDVPETVASILIVAPEGSHGKNLNSIPSVSTVISHRHFSVPPPVASLHSHPGGKEVTPAIMLQNESSTGRDFSSGHVPAGSGFNHLAGCLL